MMYELGYILGSCVTFCDYPPIIIKTMLPLTLATLSMIATVLLLWCFTKRINKMIRLLILSVTLFISCYIIDTAITRTAWDFYIIKMQVVSHQWNNQ